MDKLKEYFKTHKKICILVVVAVIGVIVYCTTGQDIDENAITDQACALFGGC